MACQRGVSRYARAGLKQTAEYSDRLKRPNTAARAVRVGQRRANQGESRWGRHAGSGLAYRLDVIKGMYVQAAAGLMGLIAAYC